MPLIADDADDAGFRIKNNPNGEDHRIYITGYDRRKVTAVRGRLYHVVHGTLNGDADASATLIVFEWLLIPGELGKRFRQVEIDVTFSPHDRRPGTMLDEDLSSYTPQVHTIAPDVPLMSNVTPREVQAETAYSIGLNVGYEPFAALTVERSQKSFGRLSG